MPYVGKKPADIIATAVDTTTGTFSGAVTVTGASILDGGVDVAGNLTLDTDSGSIILKDGGTQFGLIAKTSNDLGIYASIADEDIVFKGTDGSTAITALTLDMSDAGTAIFNHDITLGSGSEISISGDSGNSGLLLRGNDSAASIVGTHGSQALVLRTNSAERLSIDGSNGNVTLTDGNLVVASGHGIDFSATSDATGMTDELLDDYETGVYTPTVTGATSGSYTVGDSATKLSYTKIGKMIHLQGQIHITGKSSPSGVVNVSLPFASGNTTDLAERSAGSVIFDSNNSSIGVSHNSGNFVNFMVSTSSSVGIFRSSEEGTGAGSLNQSHLDTGDRFTIGITYMTFA